MTHPLDEIAVEAAARAIWESEMGNSIMSIAEKFRGPIWNGTKENCEIWLSDKDAKFGAEDTDAEYTRRGRNTYRIMACAALSAAFKSARDRGMAVDFPESTTAWRVPVTIIRHKENEHD